MKDAINNNLSIQWHGREQRDENRADVTRSNGRSEKPIHAHRPRTHGSVATPPPDGLRVGWNDGNGWRILCYTIIVAIAASQGPLGK